MTVWVVFWRKRCPSGRVIRKYLTRRGVTENWRLATRYTDKALAEIHASRLDHDEVCVVEETRELPAPKVSLWLKQGAEP